jgi:hypothetical protein
MSSPILLYFKCLTICLLVSLAFSLLALARRLAANRPPGQSPGPGHHLTAPLALPRRAWRCISQPPSRWQVITTGLSILFNTAAFAAVGI